MTTRILLKILNLADTFSPYFELESATGGHQWRCTTSALALVPGPYAHLGLGSRVSASHVSDAHVLSYYRHGGVGSLPAVLSNCPASVSPTSSPVCCRRCFLFYWVTLKPDGGAAWQHKDAEI